MTVNIGIIGYGRMAESAHRTLINETPGARLLAVADVTAARREVARSQGIERIYSSAAAMLKDPDIQAVSVTTPSHNHCKLALQAARAGKHVLIEKPASRTTEELRKTIAAIRKTGVHLTVFHNRRFDPDFMACQEVVRKGLVGDVLRVEMRWEQYGNGVSFGVKEYFPQWRSMKKFGGGLLLDLGVHMLDQLVHLGAGRPREVFAHVCGGVHAGNVDDFCSGMIRFDNGMVAVVDANSLTKVKLPRYRIIGTRGMAVINTETKSIDLYKGDASEPTRSISFDKPRKWNSIYRSFVDVIQGKKKALAVTPESVIATMQLIDAYRASSKSGRSVRVR